MARLKSWPSRFEALVLASRRRPFEWGAFDCCLWAANGVQACMGVDLAARWRGTYSDAASALRLVEQLGGMEAIGAMAGPEMSPRRATVGDVGLVELADRLVLAVHGGQLWLAAGSVGLEVCPASSVIAAWRVGGANG